MSSPSSENPYQTPQAPLGPPRYPSRFRSRNYCTEAIVALIFAVVGLFLCCIIPACSICLESIALVLSIVAFKKIGNDPSLQGRGMAIAAMVISICVLAPSLLLWLLWVAFTIFTQRRGGARKSTRAFFSAEQSRQPSTSGAACHLRG